VRTWGTGLGNYLKVRTIARWRLALVADGYSAQPDLGLGIAEPVVRFDDIASSTSQSSKGGGCSLESILAHHR
jgi:hypothetical protein